MLNFKSKKILITGANGFVGSNLRERLVSLGAEVISVSRSSNKIGEINADILEYNLIDKIIKKKAPAIIIHLAGEVLVESGQKDPYNTFKSNIDGTLNILELSRKNNIEKIIIASTSHVYGRNKVPYFEQYLPRPSRPYETSKTCTDLIAQSYSDSFNLPVLIPRFVNLYGPGDKNYERLIPKTIKKVLSNEAPEMWGGEAVRDYMYIDDALDAYISLLKVDMKKVGKNRIFNFGTGNTISVEKLIKKIVGIIGMRTKIKKINEDRKDEIKAQYVSWKKAEKILSWKPKISLEEGLKLTIDWYKKIVYNR